MLHRRLCFEPIWLGIISWEEGLLHKTSMLCSSLSFQRKDILLLATKTFLPNLTLSVHSLQHCHHDQIILSVSARPKKPEKIWQLFCKVPYSCTAVSTHLVSRSKHHSHRTNTSKLRGIRSTYDAFPAALAEVDGHDVDVREHAPRVESSGERPATAVGCLDDRYR